MIAAMEFTSYARARPIEPSDQNCEQKEPIQAIRFPKIKIRLFPPLLYLFWHPRVIEIHSQMSDFEESPNKKGILSCR